MQPLAQPERAPLSQRPRRITAIATREDGEIMPIPGQPVSRVLILEDDSDIGAALALAVSGEEGFSVEVVADVASCLDRLRARGGNAVMPPFDVLLLDLILRGGHLGTEVLRAAAQPGAALRLPAVVVCTAHSRDYLTRHAPEIAASNVRVVRKPFDLDELMRAVRLAALGALGD